MYNVTFTFSQWDQVALTTVQKTITKQVKVRAGVPLAPVVKKPDTCVPKGSQWAYTFSTNCQNCPNTSKQYEYLMKEDEYVVTITNENVCGQSAPVSVTIPSWIGQCKTPGQVRTVRSDENINLSIIYDVNNGFLFTKTDRLYYADFKAEVIDSYGRVLYSKSYDTSDMSLNINDFAQKSGIYFYKITTPKGSQWIKKFVYVTE
jgi:hypothetical protein